MLVQTACGKSSNIDTPKAEATALVSNGKTDYTVVYAENETDSNALTAVSELTNYFYQATGINLTTESDKNLVWTDEAKYISVGETTLMTQVNLSVKFDDLGYSGYIVKKVGNSVFLSGAMGYGTLYSVYEFLAQQFNYEYFYKDTIRLDKNVKNLELINYDLTIIPSFDLRETGFSEASNDLAYLRGIKSIFNGELFAGTGGTTYHNWLDTVDVDDNRTKHPDWFSADGLQLCLTRDMEGLGDFVSEKMIELATEKPSLGYIIFTQEDFNVWCNCAECTEMLDKYGANSASNIHFMNYCARKVKAAFPDRDIKLVMFAYHQCTEAPAVYNASTGKYEPIDDSVIVDDNVVVYYAPIYASGYFDFYSEKNQGFDVTMQKWAAICKNIHMWTYSMYWKDYFLPYYDFGSMQSMYQYAAAHNVVYMFDQQQTTQTVPPDWGRLKIYLNAKLEWDVNADYKTLVNDFFVNYFKDASDTMLELFNDYCIYSELMIDKYNLSGLCNNLVLQDKTYWPQAKLNHWLDLIQQAYADIEYLKNVNMDEYNNLYDKICLESLTYRYLSNKFYSSVNYSGNTFKSDVLRLGISNSRESGLIDAILD